MFNKDKVTFREFRQTQHCKCTCFSSLTTKPGSGGSDTAEFGLRFAYDCTFFDK